MEIKTNIVKPLSVFEVTDLYKRLKRSGKLLIKLCDVYSGTFTRASTAGIAKESMATMVKIGLAKKIIIDGKQRWSLK